MQYPQILIIQHVGFHSPEAAMEGAHGSGSVIHRIAQ
jgi:hypothetical protein